MVLEVLSDTWPVILVNDMVIFSNQVIHSDMPNEIPWSDRGSQYTRYFPYHPSHRISVFGNKMAYALPWDCIPEHGAPLEKFSDNQDHFYVHIWDFNKRTIARAENDYDRSSPDPLICTPGQLTGSCFVGNIISNHPYTATVCRRLVHRSQRMAFTAYSWNRIGLFYHGSLLARSMFKLFALQLTRTSLWNKFGGPGWQDYDY
ncbi:hypothetical protein K503DRAFT_132437 [Rhizopogon vinicolor AM-OR11-026]|uniref:Uncharacterized protein n=1 Tax=Rhizopogon vinicolor AM-OR11-026 TaxID=1314800 RepID=A0A1B7N1W0_9AGAM|nr:hypothetical protein K503DRAFT_132437 [Rhizopogon vinicolor AM-OR11-026]